MAGCAFQGLFRPEPEAERLLEILDVDGNGQLTGSEIDRAGLRLAGLDRNGDGRLDEGEIGPPGSDPQTLRSWPIVRVLDRDGDGFITRLEMLQAADYLPDLDTNDDGRISRAEALEASQAAGVERAGRLPEGALRLLADSDEITGPLPPPQERAYAGYLLYAESNGPGDRQMASRTWLLAPDGSVAHVWQNPRRAPEGSGAYLLESGLLLRQSAAERWPGPGEPPAGAHGIVELVDWEGNVVWEYSRCEAAKHCLHHDMEPLPGGNVLVSSYEAASGDELSELGGVAEGETGLTWFESILELAPNLEDGSTEIVWRWDSWNHLVQDVDSGKPGYGEIRAAPDRLDVNHRDPLQRGPRRLFEISALSYDALRDQILVTSGAFGELWILDHSTTTAEAASAAGGRSGRGGRILFRWGNPAAHGASGDRVLFGAHDASWLGGSLPNAGGQLLVQNNGFGRDLYGRPLSETEGYGIGSSYTDLLEVALPMRADGSYGAAVEARVVWRWAARPPSSYYTPFLGGAARLPNGNTFALVSYSKRVIELSPQGRLLLDFFLPGPGQVTRAHVLPPQHPGLARLRD